MSNRLLGVIILLGFGVLASLLYYYFFIFSLFTLTVNSNVDNYVVEIYNKRTLDKDIQECSLNKCEINNLSAFDYEITFKKSGFDNYVYELSKNRQDLSIDISLDKTITFQKVEQQDNSESNIQSKIDDLIKKKNSYKYIEFDDGNYFIFKKIDNSLELHFNTKRVRNFDLVNQEFIRIDQIVEGINQNLGVDSYYVKVGDNKFIYNSKQDKFYKLDLGLSIKYIKSGLNNNYLAVTNKGTFVFYINKNELEYFSMFNDFVFWNDLYIASINNDDEIIRSNLGINGNKNIVLLFNPESKEKKIIYETEVYLDKLYFVGQDLHIQDKVGDKYILDNF